MSEHLRRPISFFVVSVVVLSFISGFDVGLFHYLVDFVNITIGIMMFVIAINSKVYSEKSIFLVLAVSYLYISCIDLLHLVTLTGVSTIDQSLNHSFQYFASARIFEASMLVTVFSNIKTPENVRYKASHIIGAFILITTALMVYFEVAQVYYIEGIGQTAVKLFLSYITTILFIISAFLVHKSDAFGNNKYILIGALLLKAFAQLSHSVFVDMGDIFQVIAMILRYISYGGLYIVFIQQTVREPYDNVYKLFEIKEKELLNLSQKDSLTGIYNHSLTFKKIEEMILKIGKKYKSLCVILFDIDNFKQINDSYGHIMGDEMLVIFTTALGKLAFKDQMVGRYGGDEFVLAIPDCKESDIDSLFKRLNVNIKEMADKTGVQITFSAGVVKWYIGDNATDMIRKADIKMYQAKDKGKNQYMIWQKEIQE